MTTITIGSKTYNLVPLPSSPGISQVQIIMSDTVGSVVNPFTGETQTQTWGGGDNFHATITLPPMSGSDVPAWRAFLGSLRGITNVIQLGDPDYTGPQGSVSGTPQVNMATAGTNAPMSTTLYTKGWTVSTNNLLLPGDYIQIGYRLHMVVDSAVNSDSGGDATISIWPSIRDTLTDGEAIITANPQGLFRLAQNIRGWHASPQSLTNITLQLTEAR